MAKGMRRMAAKSCCCTTTTTVMNRDANFRPVFTLDISFGGDAPFVTAAEFKTFLDFISDRVEVLTFSEEEGHIIATFKADDLTSLNFSDSEVTDLVVFDVPSVTSLDLSGNELDVADVNGILVMFNVEVRKSPFVLDLSGQTPAAVPTGAGDAAKTALIGRGCTITTD